MEFNLPGSQKAMRKQNAMGEIRTPWTVAFTMDYLWSALARHSSVLASFHGHG